MTGKKERYPSILSDFGWDSATLAFVILAPVFVAVGIVAVWVTYGVVAAVAALAFAVVAIFGIRSLFRSRARKRAQRYARELYR